jgi:predicted dehydrogenase
LPHYLHHPIALRCIQAGKHVLVEKEMSTSYELSLDMVRAAQEAQVTLMVGQSRRYYDAVQESVRLAQAGEIGRIFNVVSLWQVKVEKALTGWWKSRAQAGGLLLALNGSHAVDYITWLKGYAYPKRVYCQLGHINPDWQGEDEVTLVMTYADGSTATVHLSFNMAESRHFRIIEGTGGSMYLDNETTLTVNGQTRVSGEQKPNTFALQVKEFADSIRQGREPLSSGRLVAPVNAILDIAFESARTNQALDLPARYPELGI